MEYTAEYCARGSSTNLNMIDIYWVCLRLNGHKESNKNVNVLVTKYHIGGGAGFW